MWWRPAWLLMVSPNAAEIAAAAAEPSWARLAGRPRLAVRRRLGDRRAPEHRIISSSCGPSLRPSPTLPPLPERGVELLGGVSKEPGRYDGDRSRAASVLIHGAGSLTTASFRISGLFVAPVREIDLGPATGSTTVSWISPCRRVEIAQERCVARTAPRYPDWRYRARRPTECSANSAFAQLRRRI